MHIPFDNTYARLPEGFFARLDPVPVAEPFLIRANRDLAEELGIEPAWLDSPEALQVFSGNALAEGSEPIAMAYAGHQFGGFAGLLGDGRALLLGEVVDKQGVRRDIQLKGSGQTPFSRRGDGKSALGPVLREYVVSEAMTALGVPATRALAAVATGEKVHRETTVPGGVFTRVASSHIRVGTFEWFAARQDHANLRVLADYVIDRHYPDVRSADNPYLGLLAGVIARQAELIAHWMQMGFIHGVMNTDNMSVSGETIDFGPCAFLDVYHPEKVFSSIDHQGRYAFNNQSPIGYWNLTRFAETLLPLLHEDSEKAITAATAELERFASLHRNALQKRYAAKIGLPDGSADDWTLAQALLHVMAEGEADFTLVFRRLAGAFESGRDETVAERFNCPKDVTAWLTEWRKRLSGGDQGKALELMRRSNPILIPRNHRVEEAIQAAYQGDYGPFNRLNDALQRPFEERPEFAEYETPPKPNEVVRETFCGT